MEGTRSPSESSINENESIEASPQSESPECEENKPQESTSSTTPLRRTSDPVSELETEIIERMDADANVVRQRRLAFFENRRETLIGNEVNVVLLSV